ncbi:MAG: Ig-like domain-containing protein [Pseudomonadota bacterium]
MAAIDYVVRDGDGRLVRGTVASSGADNVILVDTQSEISLNLARGDIYDYKRIGSILEITLQDGRILVLEGFFSEAVVTESRLYLSADGELIEITFSESWGRTNYAHFDAEAATDAEAELLFEQSSGVVTETETTMAAVPLVLGGGWGAAGAAGAALVGTQVIGGGDDGGGGGSTVPNTVDETDQVVSEDEQSITINGTAQVGSQVFVTLGETVLETAPDENGNWSVTFEGDAFPDDGNYTASIVIIGPDGVEEELVGPGVIVDTSPPELGVTSGVESTGDVIDAAWHDGGVELSGTGEPGSTIAVAVEGNEQRTVVDADGNWYVNLPVAVVPAGTYALPIQISATDAAGNTTVLDEVLVVDTEANELALGAAGVGIDDVINDAENAQGVSVSGTATPGATVVLSLAGVTVEAVAGDDGTWAANFGAGALPPGEYDAVLLASTTDAAGNVTSESLDVHVDTLGFVTIEAQSVAGDGVVNAFEAADGITFTGMTQPGSSVEVLFAGVTYTAEVDADGAWSVDVPASDIAPGEYSETATATATDAAGNVTIATGEVRIDTEFDVALDDVQVGDNVITAQEAQAGIIITGTTQPGSTVVVTLDGVDVDAAVSSDGTWAASYTTAQLPEGLRELDLSVAATDVAGNTASDTGTLSLDTLGFVAISDAPVEGDGTINDIEAQDGVVFSGTTQPGSAVAVSLAGAALNAVVAEDGTWTATFADAQIPSGTYEAILTATATSQSGNESTATATVAVDTEVVDFSLVSGPTGADNILGGDDLDAGVTVSGTTELGSSVAVTIAGATLSATVADDGTWTATFPSGSIPEGTYATSTSVVTTDPSGNQETITQAVTVDTEPGTLTISAAALEGDDVVNAAEAADGVTVTGTADPDAVVHVTLGSVSKTVVAKSDGDWTAYFSGSEIPGGTYEASITAFTVDPAGNRADVSDAVQIDTEVTGFAIAPEEIEGDGLISRSEASDGVLVSGTVEPGATVSVKLGNAEVQAIVSADGTWTAVIPANELESGEYVATLLATATDAAGNTSVLSDTLTIDTEVSNLSIATLPVSDGEVLNVAASANGIAISGTVEAGSTVLVTFEGTSQYATVSGDGAWTATFTNGDIPTGEYTADVSVLATDAHGNTGTTTAEFEVDNQAPGAPLVTAFSTGITGIRGISTLIGNETVEIAEITDLGAVQDLNYTTTEDTAFGEVNYRFTSPVSDGADLVVTASDAAGNSASTLFVLESEDDPNVSLTHSGLNGFDIEAVDLQFASDADLTLTADVVKELSSNSDELTIHGGSDDQVTMQDAVKTNEVRQIGTQTYDVYTLGDDGVSVVIDQDIEVVI